MEVGDALDISFMEEIFYKNRKYFLYRRISLKNLKFFFYRRNCIDGEIGFLNL